MQPGSIVRCRNRDWVVLPSDDQQLAILRPLTGTDDDAIAILKPLATLIAYSIPSERIEQSSFPLPRPDRIADASSTHLLWQSARLLLRDGAAPFHSLGRVSIRPRTYQFVPLLMALRLDPVRMLIADDVGVGKTIEAGIIVRELWDRGEIRRLAVLCPPYLCDQWQKELREKFHLDAVVVSPATLGHLQRQAPPGRSIWQHYPVQVISIDFVKHERNKHAFLLHAPQLVIVDEAHGVTPGHGQERHLRYALVRELAQDSKRHLLLLTATPHSGIPEAFQKLLGLVDPSFEHWDFAQLTKHQRVQLARHYLQRTRRDIQQHWESEHCFPRRETLDATYSLSPAYQRLFAAVYDFCTGIVRSGEELARHRRRMRWWGALALLRCVMSSPRAAATALHKRRKQQRELSDLEEGFSWQSYSSAVYEPTEQAATDEAPTPLIDRTEVELSDPERRRLRELERLAESLSVSDDTKLQECVRIVRQLLLDEHYPVVWCYYVETAEYVAEQLAAALATDHVRVECLTGRIGEEERRLRVDELLNTPSRRVLVATDCLSEGINLQKGFSAVLHYDLPWNPNRLEQREGRVDRFEQPSPVVKAVRFYGKDNPVDGAVIAVLLDKAREIRQTLGTYVPIPEDDESVVEVLVHALFLGQDRPRHTQLELTLEQDGQRLVGFHRSWELDARREKERRTRFAQHALDPDEVRRELEATDQVLGDPATVHHFVLNACQRLGLQVRPSRRGADAWELVTEPVALASAPEAVRRAIPSRRAGSWTIAFSSPTPDGADYVGRNHPFVVALARYLFEQAFDSTGELVVSRCGAIRTRAVEELTALFLLRQRYQLTEPNRFPLLSEEVLAVGWQLSSDRWLAPDRALPLLSAEPSANLSSTEKCELVSFVLAKGTPLLGQERRGPLFELLRHRAAELQAAHQRIRQSIGQSTRRLRIEPHWPPDLLGLLVLQPQV